MKIIHWIGIDDHADKWTIAHFKGNEDKPAREFELRPVTDGYRKLIKYAKSWVARCGSCTKPGRVATSCIGGSPKRV